MNSNIQNTEDQMQAKGNRIAINVSVVVIIVMVAIAWYMLG